MIEVADREKAIRLVEVFHTLSVILPIYDEEARSLFRASFKVDMVDMIPKFFQSLALESLQNPEQFLAYMTYFKKLIKYLDGELNELPKPDNAQDGYFTAIRHEAEKMLNAWKVVSK